MNRKPLILTLMAVLALMGSVVATASPAPVGPTTTGTVTQQSMSPVSPLVAVDSTFTYQGVLNQGGQPVNGQRDFTFKLYDADSGGNQVGGTVSINNVTVTNGLYSISLNFGASAFQGSARWLETSVNSITLSPRQPIKAVPYAMSLMPGAVITGTNGAPLLSVINNDGSLISDVGGLYAESASGYAVRGTSNGSGNYSAAGVYGSSNNGSGVFGWSDIASGVFGYSNSGVAIYGITAAGSNGAGVQGTSDGGSGVIGVSNNGYGGYFTTTNGVGVYAHSNGDNQSGVYAVSTGDFGTGVYAVSAGTGVYATSGTGNGMWGNSASGSGVYGVSASGNGVWGNSNNSSGTASGVNGTSTGTNGTGVSGVANTGINAVGVRGSSASGYGMYGISTNSIGVRGDSTNYYGVYGQSSTDIGVLGRSTSDVGVEGESSSYYGVYGYSDSNIGMYGQSNSYVGVYGESTGNGSYGVVGGSTGNGSNGVAGFGNCIFETSCNGVYGSKPGLGSGYAGYFQGNVYVSGTINKSAVGFKIDDPRDPANKYLYHSSVESPDMKDMYDGNATTDAHGNATVVLPGYFETLNQDFRYQLTIMGDQFAQARVSNKIKDNRFTITTDKPNIEVSWQVTGIRKDPYAEQHRMPVEQDKPANEKGYYLHPELYGQPNSKSVDPMVRNPHPAPVVPQTELPSGK